MKPSCVDTTIPRRLAPGVWRAVVLTDAAAVLVPVAALMLFVLTLAAAATEWTSPAYDRTAEGVVLATTKTTHRTAVRDRTYAVDAQFVAPTGDPVRVRSFGESPTPTGVVRVEYLAADPATARIVGLRSRPRAPSSLWFVALVTILVCVAAARAVVRTRRALRLLRFGLEVSGTLIAIRQGTIGVMGFRRHVLAFDVPVAGRVQRCTVVTEGDHSDDELGRVAPLLHDPCRPGTAVAPAELPGDLVVQGGVVTSLAPTWRLAILPLLGAAAWIGYLVWISTLVG